MRIALNLKLERIPAMLWFHFSTALLLFAALSLAVVGLPRRRMIEGVTLLVILLPLLRLFAETFIPEHPEMISPFVGLDESWQSSKITLPLMGVWGLGILIHGVILIRRWRAVNALKSAAVQPNQACVEEIAACLSLSPKMVRQSFRLSPVVKTPLVLPGLRSVVVLPMDWSSWPLRLQAGALRHEWHHLQNHDALWNVWMALFRTLFWFHPLAWISIKVWTDACEDEADQAAVGSRDPADYAQDLLGLARLQPMAAHAVGLGFLGSSHVGLQRRIRALLASPQGSRSEKSRVLRFSAPLIICALAIGCAWLGVRKHAEHVQLHEEEATLRLTANAFPADE